MGITRHHRFFLLDPNVGTTEAQVGGNGCRQKRAGKRYLLRFLLQHFASCESQPLSARVGFELAPIVETP
jgi:hypothetical protein